MLAYIHCKEEALVFEVEEKDLHNGTEAIVAALARIGVAVIKLGRITTVSLGSTSGAMTRVQVAIRINGGGLVAAVAVEVKSRLELVLDVRSASREGCENVSLGNRNGRCLD